MESSPDPAPTSSPRRRFFHRRRVRRWSITSSVLLALWLAATLGFAWVSTQRRRARFEEPTPRVAWASFEPLRLKTSDGHDLGAWFAEGRAEAPSVILLHGNGGHRAHTLTAAELFAGAGCAVLPVTLRAHGDSSGDYNDIGYSARHDVVAAVEFLEKRRPGRPILVFGSSLGAAAATFAAEMLGHRVSGYILEAPYLDLRSAVRNRTSDALPIGLEWVAYQGLLAVSPLFLPELDKTSPRDAIVNIPEEVPVLMMAGSLDSKARPEQIEVLFGRVKSHGKLVMFEKAGHLGFARSDPGLYRGTILDFLARAAHRPAVR